MRTLQSYLTPLSSPIPPELAKLVQHLSLLRAQLKVGAEDVDFQQTLKVGSWVGLLGSPSKMNFVLSAYPVLILKIRHSAITTTLDIDYCAVEFKYLYGLLKY